jgi:predicted nuclease of predicted toxin-antitoxin system
MTLRLIADENISWRLKKVLLDWDVLPSNEIRPGIRLTDLMIWQFARSNDYSILTFDEDFSELQNLHGFPPKIIWLRISNTPTIEIAALLTKLQEDIIKFLNNDELGIYEIYPWS